MLITHCCYPLVIFFCLIHNQAIPSKAEKSNVYHEGLLHAHQKALEPGNVCGNLKWHDDYRKLQQDIIEGKVPPRYFVSASGGQGTSDRLIGLITGWFAAFLSGRAFKIYEHNGVPPFEDALEYQIEGMKISNMTERAFIENAYKNRLRNGFVMYTGGTNKPAIFKERIWHEKAPIKSTNERDIFGDATYIIHDSNRGNTFELIEGSEKGFSDTKYAARLQQLGFKPHLGFYCAFHYLFKPNKHVLEFAKPWVKELMKDPDALKIGIHIRTGDQVFLDQMAQSNDKGTNSYTSVDSHPDYIHFFECAEYLERAYLGSNRGRRVIWFFVSDSLSLRKDVAQRYGPKVLTNIVDEALHSGMTHSARSMHLAFADILALSLCDLFVLQGSGISVTSAFLAAHRVQEGDNYWRNSSDGPSRIMHFGRVFRWPDGDNRNSTQLWSLYPTKPLLPGNTGAIEASELNGGLVTYKELALFVGAGI